MRNLLQIIFSSLEIGSIYALASLGIILILRTSKMTNFVQGSISMMHAFGYVWAANVIRWGKV